MDHRVRRGAIDLVIIAKISCGALKCTYPELLWSKEKENLKICSTVSAENT